MSIPWTCDAILPIEQRYASLKFRRVAKSFRLDKIDYADGCELSACVATLGPRAAKWVFQWNLEGVAAAQAVVTHLANDANVARMFEENRAEQTREDGLAILAAMREGGWKQGGVPAIVRMAIMEMRNDGLKIPEVGRRLGLTTDQVRVICNGWRKPRMGKGHRLGGGGFFAD